MPLPRLDLSGRTLAGRYRLGALVGHGGVAAVYEAEDVASGERRAVKMVSPPAGDAARIAERFHREARVSRTLDHPNIVQVLDFVAEGDALFLVMELIGGEPVSRMIGRRDLTARRALVLARQVLDALDHAHARGLVHRDIKPDNLMVVRAGEPGREVPRVKLVDFGLVKLLGDAAAEHGDETLTQTGLVFGTPAYMSPEQALGRIVDHRTDLYSLGAVVFEMLTGRAPFQSPDPLTVLRMHASAPPPTLAGTAPGQPWCTAAMEQLIAGALAKRPDARFADAAAMTTALDAAFVSLDHLPADS